VIIDTVSVTSTRETQVYDDPGEAPAHPESIMESVTAFVQSAAQGGFEVSPQGGDAMIKAIDNFLQWVADQDATLYSLQQPRKLGTSNGAKVMGPFVHKVPSDEQGFVTQLVALRDSLIKAREGIVTAMENYRRTEEASRSGFKSLEIEG
jgi:hypothetical protein